MPKITPFLWFHDQAEAAVDFYVSVFPNSRITRVLRTTAEGPGPEGSVLAIDFELDGQPVTALNGGPYQTLSEAFSFVVHARDQAEVDRYWEALSEGGQTNVCGWTKDRFGLSWQVVPDGFLDLMADPDPQRAARAMRAMMQMTKLEIGKLREAVAG
ncbi:MAG TPA: VOC family protein [Caulobacteraceae bacterium]|nr:VOC family protein [Caulobacteraceae bacterium]